MTVGLARGGFLAVGCGMKLVESCSESVKLGVLAVPPSAYCAVGVLVVHHVKETLGQQHHLRCPIRESSTY